MKVSITSLVLLATLVSGSLAAAAIKASLKSSPTKNAGRCRAPSVSPKRVEAVISQCQDEVKLAIIQEALESLQDTAETVNSQQPQSEEVARVRRDLFNKDEKKIAGCLLQCVYRQVKAVDQLGFPEAEGLIKLYTEGGDDEVYISATTRAVHSCLAISSRLIADRYQEPGLACDVSFDVFECVTNKVAEYCGKV